EQIVGLPTLREITSQTLDQFKASLLALNFAAPSVNSRLRYLRRIFYRLGPQQHRHLDGLGILFRIPYTKMLPEPGKIPRTLTIEQIAAIFDACHVASWPDENLSGIEPLIFWQGVIVLGYNLGLRRSDLLSLKHSHVDLNART